MGATSQSSLTYQSSSSITSDEHPHLWINIPLPTPEEPKHTTLPLGREHAIPTDIIPKNPGKSRVTLMAEVNDLLDWGMADDYDPESEHPSMGEEVATEADLPPPTKEEAPAPSLDTSSQASVGEMDTSLECNPIDVYPSMATCSSQSGSPTVDLVELQEGANLTATHMLSVKRSSDIERQQDFQDFQASLHQQEAEEAAANERAKITHSRKTLGIKMECAKAVMVAKYNYRMAIQEARMTRCNQLHELETANLEAMRENAAVRSTWTIELHREHAEHMHKLEEWTLRDEVKSCQDFLSACQVILHHAPQPLKENLSTSYQIVLGQQPSLLQSLPFARTPQADEQPSAVASPWPEAKQSPWPKRWHPFPHPQWSMSMDETPSKASQEGVSSSKRREALSWFSSLKTQSYRCLQSWLWPCKRSQITLLFHSSLWLAQ